MKKNIGLWMLLLIGSSVSAQAQKAVKEFENWPKGTSPVEIGKRVTDRFIVTPHTNFGRPTPPKVITYAETCAWYGALKFAKESNQKDLLLQLAKRFEPLFGEEASMIPIPDHVDYCVFGAVPLELYRQTKEKRYLEMGQSIADKQWGPPEGKRVVPESYVFYNKGLTWQTRMWIDDMFMINALQVQAYRATGEKKYLDRAAKEMVVYLDSLQKTNGLFYHAPDVPFFWGRGNGWMAAGMTEILTALPKNHPERARILKGYETMMASLLKYQTNSGMWRQLVDVPASWEESSGTAMFAYAMVTGVKNGWLPQKTYAPAARKAWLALVSRIDANADVSDVCEGTNKKNDLQYYLDRKRITGDMHGQAPILWTAAAFLQ